MTIKNLFEHYPVKVLEDRYQITKSVIYNRLDYLKIKPNRVGRESYLNLVGIESQDLGD